MSELILPIKPDFITSPMTFINSQYFCEAADYFTKHGCYTHAPEGTFEYNNYWDEQDRRCKEGYSVGGVRITGEHYAYLNFGRIKVTVGDGKKARKYESFPKFLDMDYYYYHELERAKENKEGMIVAKSRRKGFSYKGAFNTVYEYNWYRDSFSIIAAFMGDYCDATMVMALDMINFINKHTDWGKRKLISTRNHIKSGFRETINGIEVESGYKSEIMTMSFKDNPFKSIGKSAGIMLFEEAGKWHGLINAYILSKPLFSDGDINIGIPIIYGTGGDMEGGTQDFAEMFYAPSAYGLRAYENVYDENALGECGWFVSDTWYKAPYVDDNGNSDQVKAKEMLLNSRENIKRTGSKRAVQKFITQQPLTPAEAFLRMTGNIFPTADLLSILANLEASNRIQNHDWIGELTINEETGKIEWKPNAKLEPIKDFPIKKDSDTEGCLVIYEMPYEDELGNVPYSMYIAGCDPYQQDQSTTDSLGSLIVMNRITNRVVAEYTGRPRTTKDYSETVRRILLFYNAVCLYENQVKGLFDYFEEKNCLYLLAETPKLLDDIVKNSNVDRKKGCHMTANIKEYGEELIKTWLLDKQDDVLNMHKVRCIPLLKELISYHSDGNFDRVIAFIMCMFQINEMRRAKIEENNTVNDIRSSPFWNKKLFNKGGNKLF